MPIQFIDRDMTSAELAQMNAGFDQHGLEFGVPPTVPLRLTVVAQDGENFIGCASGLANDSYCWFYLTDLFVEKAYRRQGIGAALLGRLEGQAGIIGAQHIWAWTASYEAPEFYKKQGYTVFCEMPGWYTNGYSRVGLWKNLISSG